MAGGARYVFLVEDDIMARAGEMTGCVLNNGDGLKSPFPWFGGKSKVADVVWQAFGDVRNYVEPFFGSGAVLLGRPRPFDGIETVNDIDGLLANFWRAIKSDPDAVAKWADWPVNENDLHARHSWLVNIKQDFVAKLEGDPDFFDAKVAGWWVWGICAWIGSGWCSGSGPWKVVDAKLVHLGDAGRGVKRQLVHLRNAGRGVNRQSVHLGNKGANKILRKDIDGVTSWFIALSERLHRVRVCCGDWQRVCGPTPTFLQGLTGVFLDPPYADTAERDEVYTHDDQQVAHAVAEWAIANGENPLLRIALCGYEGERAMPERWREYTWEAQGGYEHQGKEASGNRNKERIWFSPACLPLVETQPNMFERKVGQPELGAVK